MTSFTERGTRPLCEKTHLGVVQPPFGFVWSSNRWWSGRVPTLGKVGFGEKARCSWPVVWHCNRVTSLRRRFFWCSAGVTKRSAFDLDRSFEFPPSGNICHIMKMIWKWYVFDMLPPCYFLVYKENCRDRSYAKSNRAANLHETWNSSDVGFPRQCLVAEWFEDIRAYRCE